MVPAASLEYRWNQFGRSNYYLAGQHLCQCLTNIRKKKPNALHEKNFECNVLHKLQVRCSEKENGYQWEGLLGELQCHQTQCQYVKEDCPYKCGDRVQHCHLEEHKANLCPQQSF